jgi:hypothetical protein
VERETTGRTGDMKVGTHVISNNKGVKGKITELRKFHEHGEVYIVIEWEGIGPVQYTEAMLYECLHEGKIKIDKQHYRNEKLDQLGI